MGIELTKRIVEEWLTGKHTTASSCARAVGTDGATVARNLRAWLPGWTPVPRGCPKGTKHKYSREPEILRRWQAGEFDTLEAAGSAFGLTRERIRQIVVANGCKESPRAKRLRERNARVMELARAGKRPKEIASLCCIPLTTVFSVAKASGYRFRRPPPAAEPRQGTKIAAAVAMYRAGERNLARIQEATGAKNINVGIRRYCPEYKTLARSGWRPRRSTAQPSPPSTP